MDEEEELDEKLLLGVEKQMEEAIENLWEYWQNQKSDAFGFLELAKDGGISEIKGLYSPMRLVSVSSAVALLMINVFHIAKLDLSFILEPRHAALALGGDAAYELIDKFYLSRSLIGSVANALGLDAPDPMRILGMLELCGLLWFCAKFSLNMYVACKGKGFLKWLAVQTVFLDLVPILSVYSAMRLLAKNVPLVMTNKAKDFHAQLKSSRTQHRTRKICIAILMWMFQTALAFMIGFDTFLMKLRIVSVVAIHGRSLHPHPLFVSVLFCIQVIGIVQLGAFTRRRLFRFVFGGEDAIIQTDEKVRMLAWNALLAQRCFEELPFHQGFAVMATFSDTDFQRLVLNENREILQHQRKKMLDEDSSPITK